MIDWYNQRREASENRIKDLKTGFGMKRMPSGETKANAVLFRIGVLAYKLFLLVPRAGPGRRVRPCSDPDGAVEALPDRRESGSPCEGAHSEGGSGYSIDLPASSGEMLSSFSPGRNQVTGRAGVSLHF